MPIKRRSNSRTIVADKFHRCTEETMKALLKEQWKRYQKTGKKPSIKSLIAEAVKKTF